MLSNSCHSDMHGVVLSSLVWTLRYSTVNWGAGHLTGRRAGTGCGVEEGGRLALFGGPVGAAGS